MLTEKTLIWSKGYFNDEYSNKKTESICSKKEIIHRIQNTENVIFIRTGSMTKNLDLDLFANNLDKLTKPCILITSDGDRPTPSSYHKNTCNKILDNSNIIKWHTQNYDKSIIHDKLDYYPIGFDLHTQKWLINNSIQSKIDFMVSCRIKSPTEKRISNKIFSDSHNSITHPSRREIYNIIKNMDLFDLSRSRKSFIDITNDYNKYNFVISPRGNGLDCHRTWELFLAGVIVIIKTSFLDDMFIKNDLPVVILHEWDELNNITENTLAEWYQSHIHKTDINHIFPKLMYNYWITLTGKKNET